MHHTCAYTISNIAAVADTDVPALQDTIVPIQNGHFLFQENRYLQIGRIGSATVVRSKLSAASLRQVSNPYMTPIEGAVLPANNPNCFDYRPNPLRLSPEEETALLSTCTGAGERQYGVFCLSRTPTLDPIPAGQIFSFRFTSVTAAVIATWTPLVSTFQDALPGGNFGVVGLAIQSTNMVAARLVLPNQYDRPGCIGQTSLVNRSHPAFLKGGLGLWGRFTSTYLPVVEVLCNVADASFEGYVEIIRLP